MAVELTKIMVEASSVAMPRKRHCRKSNPWWTSELTRFKKIAYRHGRAYRREKNQTLRVEKMLTYRISLRAYSKTIKKQRRLAGIDLSRNVEIVTRGDSSIVSKPISLK